MLIPIIEWVVKLTYDAPITAGARLAKGWPNLFGLNCAISPGAWDERNALAEAITLVDLWAREEQES